MAFQRSAAISFGALASFVSDEPRSPDSAEPAPSSFARIEDGAAIAAIIDGAIDETPLAKLEDIWFGRKIAVPTAGIVDDRKSWLHAVVETNSDGEPYWRVSEQLSGDLCFDGQSWKTRGRGRYL